ncbi:MAG TPA: carboxypeptidase regulatory-like domain-containing protein [Candidatus Limnocylindria bacterium]|nr:carboxypeptidase regulatory-like domain-containing protein [Candidatus Limnocylindria bacterium]
MRRALAVLLAAIAMTACQSAKGPTTILEGRVTDAAYQAISGASVQVDTSAAFGLVREPAGIVQFSPENDGFFSVGRLGRATYRVTASAPGYVDQTKLVEVEPPLRQTVEFVLHRR